MTLPKDLYMVCEGKRINPFLSFSSNGISNLSTIHISIPLCGGSAPIKPKKKGKKQKLDEEPAILTSKDKPRSKSSSPSRDSRVELEKGKQEKQKDVTREMSDLSESSGIDQLGQNFYSRDDILDLIDKNNQQAELLKRQLDEVSSPKKLKPQQVQKETMFQHHTRANARSRKSQSDEDSSESTDPESSILSEKSRYNPRIKDFVITLEVSNLLGLDEEERFKRRKSTKTKPAQRINLDDVKVYQRGDDFIEWWQNFKFAVQDIGINTNEIQVRYSFTEYMNDDIKKYIKDISKKEELWLEQRIEIVLSFYDKPMISDLQKKKEFMNITMKSKETVASYYLRIDTSAKQINVTDKQEIKDIYLEGLKSNIGLYSDVIKRINIHKFTLQDIHNAALDSEQSYLLIKSIRSVNVNSKSTGEKKEITKEVKDNKPKQSIYNVKSNTNNNNQPKRNNNNSNKNSNYKSNTPKINSNNNDDKQNKKTGICKYCLKEHDYKECFEKFKFYTYDEANIITKVGGYPKKRTENPKPEDRITAETDWVKKKLESSKSNQTKTTNSDASTVGAKKV
jgi:hypothetical protein